MRRATIAIEIADMPEVARLAHEVAETGVDHVLAENGEAFAIVSPVRRRRRQREMTDADRAAVLAAVGSWKGLVDPDELVRELDRARSDDLRDVTADALDLVGAWSDLDIDEMADALDRIRHESKPTPPIDLDL